MSDISKVKIKNNIIQKVKVTSVGGRLTSVAPITLKNQIQDTKVLANLADVSEVNKVEGATLVYNEDNSKYEVKLLDYDNLTGDIDSIDGGEFN